MTESELKTIYRNKLQKVNRKNNKVVGRKKGTAAVSK